MRHTNDSHIAYLELEMKEANEIKIQKISKK